MLSVTFIFNSVLTWSFLLWAVSSCILQLHLHSEEMALWAPWMHKECIYGLIGLVGNGMIQYIDDNTKSIYFFHRIPDLDVFFLEYFWHIPFWPRRGEGGGPGWLRKKIYPGWFLKSQGSLGSIVCKSSVSSTVSVPSYSDIIKGSQTRLTQWVLAHRGECWSPWHQLCQQQFERSEEPPPLYHHCWIYNSWQS